MADDRSIFDRIHIHICKWYDTMKDSVDIRKSICDNGKNKCKKNLNQKF